MLDKTYKMTRATFGNMRSNNGNRNIYSVSYGYTNFKKKPATAASGTILPSNPVPQAGTTFTPTNQPDVPRAVSVAIGAGTAADIAAGTITVTGRNVEGKVFTETFNVTADTPATLTGSKAFKSITSIQVPAQDGSSVTMSVGTRPVLGLNHRLPTGTLVTVVQEDASGVQSAQSAPTMAYHATNIESNTVTPATPSNGALKLTVHYVAVASHLNPTNGNPTYGA